MARSSPIPAGNASARARKEDCAGDGCRAAFLFDPNRCTGCHACRLACTIENDLAAAVSWRRIETFNDRAHPGAPRFHLSLACHHCADPACASACPARAYTKDSATGAVVLDPAKCIGCHYCAWACPYDAPVFDDARGVMTKCTFCNGRLHEGLDPACAAHCPTGALGFGATDPAGLDGSIPGFPHTTLGPSIRIEGLRPDRRLPEQATPEELAAVVAGAAADAAPGGAVAPALPGFAPALPHPAAPRITLRTEWPLAAFTLLVAALFGAFAATAVQPAVVPPAAFLGIAAMAMTLATLHLGTKSRAWRAVLNVRTSWLSREIVTVTVFLALAAAQLTLAPQGIGLRAAAIAAGLAALFCTDRVYGVLPGIGSPWIHSAGVLLTGLWFAGLLALPHPSGWIMVSLAGIPKIILYLRCKTAERRFGAGRLILGVAAPLALVAARGLDAIPAAAVLSLLGEAIDRCEFYRGLEGRTSPGRGQRFEPGHIDCGHDGGWQPREASARGSERDRPAGARPV